MCWWSRVRGALRRVVLSAGGELTAEEWADVARWGPGGWTEHDEAPGTATQILDLRGRDQSPPAYAPRLERRNATAEERAEVVHALRN